MRKIQILNILFPLFVIAPTTCHVYKCMLMPLCHDWPQYFFCYLNLLLTHIYLFYTDKECLMYSLSMSEARALQASAAAPEEENEKPDVPTLMQQMRDTGLVMKPGAMPLTANTVVDNDTTLTETDLISQLTDKQKKKLLKYVSDIICSSKGRKIFKTYTH